MSFAGKEPDPVRGFCKIHREAFLLLACAAVLVGCSTATPAPSDTATPQPTTTASSAPTIAATTTATASPSPLPPTSTPIPTLCSPLSGYTLEQLPGMVSNPYSPPPPGRDDPHEGIDLAITDPPFGVALGGNPVQAVLYGRVAMVVNDRFPYGNAVMIETPIDTIHPNPIRQAWIPTPDPHVTPHPALTCPPMGSGVNPQTIRRSLYLVYAHLENPSRLQIGDQVACGQGIGSVGSSGNALNPHLHLEVRVGPSGMRFTSMSHYDASATPEEMTQYCIWRVSGAFQLIDPLQLLLLAPSGNSSP